MFIQRPLKISRSLVPHLKYDIPNTLIKEKQNIFINQKNAPSGFQGQRVKSKVKFTRLSSQAASTSPNEFT